MTIDAGLTREMLPITVDAPLIELAIFGSGFDTYSHWYKAETVIGDDGEMTWEVVGEDPNRPGTIQKVLTLDDFVEAAVVLIGDRQVRLRLRSACLILLCDGDNADLDAADADVIVQQAVYGNEIFV